MGHARRSATGYDVDAPKRRVNVTLNADLVRVAQSYTENLSGTIEHLLASWAHAERAKREDDLEHRKRVAAVWNDFDERHGRFADEWNRDYAPDGDPP